ncbi:hypothetical protein WICMUC_005685 [Wickerhamomyces mucosus]|uniref:Arginine N-methyltransferase 2 n=1 Tax=Wickerhamomyces mucosus TaxID=1378264 RepID=A0A9P8P7T5_9ASCO|nr:hypothetical protein WICMUC_005685 [Wickerhamomyces mucosus]
MSELHELCQFPNRPITSEYLTQLKYFLKEGIPATYTLEEAINYELGKEDEELSSTTTPLHLICRSLPKDLTEEESKVVQEMIEELFSWGAGWNLIDDKGLTPGDILFDNGFRDSPFYQIIVDAGVRAELLLRKINDGDYEFLSEDEGGDIQISQEEELLRKQIEEQSQQEESEEPQKQEEVEEVEEKTEVPELVDDKVEQLKQEFINDPAGTQSTFLNTKLIYKDGALITDQQDGVMMDWENEIMSKSCDTIFKSTFEKETPEEDLEEINVLNIGFGMGIIDTMIQAKNPTHHYICEAHPDVLTKLEEDGWFTKPNVTVLKGRWQDTLPELLTKGIFFNGIYYDTFSEHYTDMLDLFDLIVGLLKPSGIFSFFNGLGADRQIIYDVYKKIAEIDLNNYGLKITFEELETPKLTLKEFDNNDESIWNGIKRPYWRCQTYYHPEIRFY